MKIIGNCPFCQREVGSDMRPINQLNMEHINILASELKDIQPGSTTLEKVSQHSEIRDSKTEASKEDEQSMSFLTKAMLNMVKEQFERPPDAEVNFIFNYSFLAFISCLCFPSIKYLAITLSSFWPCSPRNRIRTKDFWPMKVMRSIPLSVAGNKCVYNLISEKKTLNYLKLKFTVCAGFPCIVNYVDTLILELNIISFIVLSWQCSRFLMGLSWKEIENENLFMGDYLNDIKAGQLLGERFSL